MQCVSSGENIANGPKWNAILEAYLNCDSLVRRKVNISWGNSDTRMYSPLKKTRHSFYQIGCDGVLHLKHLLSDGLVANQTLTPNGRNINAINVCNGSRHSFYQCFSKTF